MATIHNSVAADRRPKRDSRMGYSAVLLQELLDLPISAGLTKQEESVGATMGIMSRFPQTMVLINWIQ